MKRQLVQDQQHLLRHCLINQIRSSQIEFYLKCALFLYYKNIPNQNQIGSSDNYNLHTLLFLHCFFSGSRLLITRKKKYLIKNIYTKRKKRNEWEDWKNLNERKFDDQVGGRLVNEEWIGRLQAGLVWSGPDHRK